MKIPVVLINGEKQFVSEEETLQFMIATKQVHSFKRAEGWVVIGRDEIRHHFSAFQGSNRRKTKLFAKVCWNC